MASIFIPFGRLPDHHPKNPERTAYRPGRGTFDDYEVKTWPNEESLRKMLEKQDRDAELGTRMWKRWNFRLQHAVNSNQSSTSSAGARYRKQQEKEEAKRREKEQERSRDYRAGQDWYHHEIYRAAEAVAKAIAADRGSGQSYRLYYKTGHLKFFPRNDLEHGGFTSKAPDASWHPTDLVEEGWHTKDQIVAAITKIAGRLSLYPTTHEFKSSCFDSGFNIVCGHKHE